MHTEFCGHNKCYIEMEENVKCTVLSWLSCGTRVQGFLKNDISRRCINDYIDIRYLNGKYARGLFSISVVGLLRVYTS